MDYSSSGDTAAVGVFMLVMILTYVVVVAVMVASLWKLFTKAKKPGWAAIVPFYNTIVMLEIVGRPLWWFVGMFIPFVNIWFSVVLTLDFAKSYGKSTLYGVLLILLPIVGFPLLAFGKDTHYVGPVAEGLEGFMPAPDRGPTPGSPTNTFTTAPAFVPPAPAPAPSGVPADTPTATVTPATFSQPTTPVQPQASGPVTPFQPSVEAPVVPAVSEPLVVPTAPEAPVTPESPATPRSD